MSESLEEKLLISSKDTMQIQPFGLYTCKQYSVMNIVTSPKHKLLIVTIDLSVTFIWLFSFSILFLFLNCFFLFLITLQIYKLFFNPQKKSNFFFIFFMFTLILKYSCIFVNSCICVLLYFTTIMFLYKYSCNFYMVATILIFI